MTIGSFGKNKFSAIILVTWSPFARQDIVDALGATDEEARNTCLALAKNKGWAPPKWWQWWRSGDSIEPEVSKIVL